MATIKELTEIFAKENEKTRDVLTEDNEKSLKSLNSFFKVLKKDSDDRNRLEQARRYDNLEEKRERLKLFSWLFKKSKDDDVKKKEESRGLLSGLFGKFPAIGGMIGALSKTPLIAAALGVGILLVDVFRDIANSPMANELKEKFDNFKTNLGEFANKIKNFFSTPEVDSFFNNVKTAIFGTDTKPGFFANAGFQVANTLLDIGNILLDENEGGPLSRVFKSLDRAVVGGIRLINPNAFKDSEDSFSKAIGNKLQEINDKLQNWTEEVLTGAANNVGFAAEYLQLQARKKLGLDSEQAYFEKLAALQSKYGKGETQIREDLERVQKKLIEDGNILEGKMSAGEIKQAVDTYDRLRNSIIQSYTQRNLPIPEYLLNENEAIKKLRQETQAYEAENRNKFLGVTTNAAVLGTLANIDDFITNQYSGGGPTIIDGSNRNTQIDNGDKVNLLQYRSDTTDMKNLEGAILFNPGLSMSAQ